MRIMNKRDLQSYCLAKKGVEKSYPFDQTTAVYKVGNKMFVLSDDRGEPLSLNVKCDPLYALELRSIYEAVEPGYHMSKKHWNTLGCEKDLDDKLIYEMVDESYQLVFESLSKKLQKEILEDV